MNYDKQNFLVLVRKSGWL